LTRTKALQIAVVCTGCIFVALLYPLVVFLKEEPALSMMFSVYVTLGVYLFVAARRPSEHRSLIGFTAWSSLAHAIEMGFQALAGYVAFREMIGVGVLLVIGVALLALNRA
jgi:hypothetical protein